jgi:hypothetical protein
MACSGIGTLLEVRSPRGRTSSGAIRLGEDLQDHAGEVWHRACVALATGWPSEARTGDLMLLRAIDFDGRVNNGGLLNRAEEDEDLDGALEALRWFGLVEVAERVEGVRDRWRRLAAEGAPLGAAEQLEQDADELYFEMPQGQVADQLEAALLTRLEEDPAAFSPL